MKPVRTSWRAKLNKDQPPRLVETPPKMQRQWGVGKMLIPRPLDVDALVRRIPIGKLATVSQIMERLAREQNAATSCPMCTGIFLRIVAEAAEEDRRDGKTDITPYWRVLKSDGSLNPKFPGGVEAHSLHLQAEGHELLPAKGKQSPKVRDFSDVLAEL